MLDLKYIEKTEYNYYKINNFYLHFHFLLLKIKINNTYI